MYVLISTTYGNLLSHTKGILIFLQPLLYRQVLFCKGFKVHSLLRLVIYSNTILRCLCILYPSCCSPSIYYILVYRKFKGFFSLFKFNLRIKRSCRAVLHDRLDFRTVDLPLPDILFRGKVFTSLLLQQLSIYIII